MQQIKSHQHRSHILYQFQHLIILAKTHTRETMSGLHNKKDLKTDLAHGYRGFPHHSFEPILHCNFIS